MQELISRPNLIKLGAAAALIVLALSIRHASQPQLRIHIAAWDGNLSAVRGALAHGIDVDERDENGRTPLHIAAVWGHIKIVRLLLDKGANVNTLDGNGCTPLDWALDTVKGDTVALLREHGGKQNRRPPH